MAPSVGINTALTQYSPVSASPLSLSMPELLYYIAVVCQPAVCFIFGTLFSGPCSGPQDQLDTEILTEQLDWMTFLRPVFLP